MGTCNRILDPNAKIKCVDRHSNILQRFHEPESQRVHPKSDSSTFRDASTADFKSFGSRCIKHPSLLKWSECMALTADQEWLIQDKSLCLDPTICFVWSLRQPKLLWPRGDDLYQWWWHSRTWSIRQMLFLHSHSLCQMSWWSKMKTPFIKKTIWSNCQLHNSKARVGSDEIRNQVFLKKWIIYPKNLPKWSVTVCAGNVFTGTMSGFCMRSL